MHHHHHAPSSTKPTKIRVSCLSFSIFFWVLPRTFLTSLVIEHNWIVSSVLCTKLCHNLNPSSPPFTPAGNFCEHPDENWMCLSCKEVLCSRFVNKHMLYDLLVWCFSCDAHLDAQLIQQLRPVYETAFILKLGEAPPL
ncbi:hypothetical protein UlMin_033695 [Ulmus minor]